ncbi:MAG: wbbL 5 [Thermoleophilia bacterium]|nr:wbbL 5 [Thermoleophilia bacterium]
MTMPTTSIVILTRNQLDYTTQCVDGIARTTPEPHELVFVDNGSTDGTVEYLRSLPDAIVIENGRNLGFGGGCNLGIAASAGERILLLNNDVVPTAGWLAELHAALDSGERIGLAGPRSNRIVGVQQVDDVGYEEETLDGLDAWSASWRASQGGRLTRIPRLVGFCILMERAVVERIGGFDLRYGLGNFEDDDLCLRAGVGGFECRIAHASFVHHFGSRTFAGEGIDHGATIFENYARFAAAWQLTPEELDPQTHGYPADRLMSSTRFDATRHHAPLVGVADDAGRVALDGHRERVVLVCCDRLDPDATEVVLRATCATFGPSDPVTVVVRIDPRDGVSPRLLDAVADEIGDAQLPDIVVVEASDEDDRPALRVANEVVVHGRFGPARRLLANHLGVHCVTPEDLTGQTG